MVHKGLTIILSDVWDVSTITLTGELDAANVDYLTDVDLERIGGSLRIINPQPLADRCLCLLDLTRLLASTTFSPSAA